MLCNFMIYVYIVEITQFSHETFCKFYVMVELSAAQKTKEWFRRGKAWKISWMYTAGVVLLRNVDVAANLHKNMKRSRREEEKNKNTVI